MIYAFDKLVPRLSIFRAFLVSPKNLPEDEYEHS